MVANAGDKKVSSLPFPAIVGQQELKRVLLAVAVNDELDGALVSGEKGTAKSTAVRALVDLLPEQRVVADCPYGCSPEEPPLQCEDCRERSNRNRGELPVDTRPVPFVTLPLGATRDRVVGTLSVEDALAGEADFDPGLLARAHRGILYVDEVNLLEDHLVDVILDAAASGVNTVERDGMSVSHPAEFTLIGTMNPEEGDLRPQLRDRFALQATVEGCREVEDRVEIIDRSLGLEADTSRSGSNSNYADDVRTLRTDLEEARDRLSAVELPSDFKADIARLCLEAGVDGHRGDIATARTARTLAALEGRTTVIEPDIHEAASYTLPHRLRSTPFEETPDLDELLEDEFNDSSDVEDGAEEEHSDRDGSGDSETESDERTGNENGGGDEPGDGETDSRGGGDSPADTDSDGEGERTPESTPEPTAADDSSDSGENKSGSSTPTGQQAGSESGSETVENGNSGNEDGSRGDDSRDGNDESGDDGTDHETATPLLPGQRADVGEAAAPDLEVDPRDHETPSNASGGSRAKTSPSTDGRGARVRTEPASANGKAGSIDAAASVRSAASRGESSVGERDLRQSVRSGDAAVTIVFAVDASASMRPAMRTAKGVVLDLLRDSYQNRDEVAFVAFAGDDADVLLPPTNSVTLAARHLKDLPSGDRTPLPAGLETTRAVLERTESDASVVVLVTDGGANVAGEAESPTDATRQAARRLSSTGASVVVVDAGDDSRAGLSELVAAETGGELVSLSSLSVETVRSAAESDSTGE